MQPSSSFNTRKGELGSWLCVRLGLFLTEAILYKVSKGIVFEFKQL